MTTTIQIGNDRIDRDPNTPMEPTASDALTGRPTTVAPQGDFLRIAPPADIRDKGSMLYDSVFRIDQDDDLQFQLRGHSLNPLIDAAQPLLGLVIRLRRLDRCDDIPKLYASVRDQITALSEEVRQLGYDGATQLAYRYALCAFIDEAVMATAWGQASLWRERSLLSYHHNETWGGEKFFTVLARMQIDPARYRDVLEFKYLCLCLGFQGKYGQQHNNRDTLNSIIVKLHRILRVQRGDAPERLTDGTDNVASRRYRLARQWPLWTPWAIAAVVVAAAYVYFSVRLGGTTEQVLRSLENILKS
ncbi:type IVB secretion system protein IcmH/DotU [Pseudomonas aeruginosa]|uniref:type IVB secretion system protein IcmH/DotU n=1 Tax=Pseudomonas aeruginosa TaxID=287 RepID=UPI00214959B8|nr:type IVB secretion system protein IcmH/DotU [Pseudomonas aeruginosa]MCQ9837194.1 type IVB secretion system protein IcmH/DotU [Pseudomonas aeruginosa]MCQ9863041.1 type IVB secretion system protein IcmH/DotU [Pseudomonas aeruginosa]MCS8056776.1 type IVB secretion system protein IcmH/DotU [Pseudomonas aeruginosa]MCT0838288.1 type IVB secretion system protein IcmH/DotU [Pseudomonas aeruginosa]